MPYRRFTFNIGIYHAVYCDETPIYDSYRMTLRERGNIVTYGVTVLLRL